MIQRAARCFEQIVNGARVHTVRQHARRFLIGGKSNQRGTIKSIKRMNFNIFHFNHIAGFYHDAAIFRHAPADPQIHTGLWPNKRHVVRAVLHDRSRDINVDVIVMIVRSQHRIDLANRKRIKYKRRSTQVWLQFLHARHALHLVTGFHQRITVTLLTCSAPEIDADVSPAFRL